MNEIKAKSFLMRTVLGLTLGFASFAGHACGGDDTPPDGPSGGTCGGLLGQACPAGQFCDYEAGSCGHGDVLGACQSLPALCTEECTKVCGCDGQFYCNACMAHVAGVDDSADATCQGAVPTAN